MNAGTDEVWPRGVPIVGQRAERTRAVFEKTGLDEGVQVQVDGAGLGTAWRAVLSRSTRRS